VLDGQIWVAPDCWDGDPEIEALFDGAGKFPPE
jgi:hypothetical protein